MNGVKFLLDTNYILGILKATPDVLADADKRQLRASNCAYSSITRMELLGFPGISKSEEEMIAGKLEQLNYLGLNKSTEDKTISLRQTYKVKLPDAIIAATALEYELELLTFDSKLDQLFSSLKSN